MNRLSKTLLGVGLALGVSLGAVAIAAPYIALRGSFAFAEDAETRISGVPLRASLDTGWGVSGAFGNEFGPVHLEFEGVYRGFATDRIINNGVATAAAADLALMAPMANVIVDLPLDDYMLGSTVRPYIGAGIGGVYAQLHPTVGGSPLIEDDSWGFAYQFMGGVAIPVMNNVTMRMGYRYFAAPNVKFHAAGGAPFKTDLEVHSVDIGFDFRF